MVRYAENLLERTINKLVLLSIFIILGMLFTDAYFFFSGGVNPLNRILVPLGLMINLVFIVDLVLIFRKRRSVKEFLKHNWLDIIACMPLDLLRVAKATRIAKLARFTKLSRHSKIVRILPGFRSFLYFKTAKVFSRETEITKQIDRTRDKIYDMKIQKQDNEMKRIVKELERLSY